MSLPFLQSDSEPERTVGPSYAVVLTPAAEAARVTAALIDLKFTGWVVPPSDGWGVAVPETPLGHVAAGRRDLPALAAALSETLALPVVTVLVRREELLLLTAHDGAEQLVSYLSDAHLLRPRDEYAWGPEGSHGGEALARLSGRPESGEDAVELLAEERGESESESERLMALARLLGWPEWLVAVTGLPKRLAGGPAVEDVLRLRAGRPGIAGRLLGKVTGVGRREDLSG